MQIISNWIYPPSTLKLSPKEVHIWRVIFPTSDEEVSKYSQLLSSDEHSRMERFHFEKDKRRFSFGRGVVRTLLGNYLGVDPNQIHFSYTEYGKPYLDQTNYEIPIHFNLTHSKDLFLYSFSYERRIGIDLEYMVPIPDMEIIDKKHFTLGENTYLQKLPENLKKEAFYKIWTCKEAYIKAVGGGLLIPLDSFEVSVLLGHPDQLLSIDYFADSPPRWKLESFIPINGYAAAIVVEGYDWLSRWFNWTE